MKRAFTLLELTIVMLIIGIGLMTFAPKITDSAVGIDERLDFFDKLLKNQYERSVELGRPIYFTGFKGSGNILTYDGEQEEIPNTDSIQKAKVNNYETKNEEYSVRIYPDGICDHFEITLKEGQVIESIPLLMKTRYKETIDDE